MKRYNGEPAWSVVCEKLGEDNWIIRQFNHDDDTVTLALWRRPINPVEISQHIHTEAETKTIPVKDLDRWLVVFAW